MSTIRKNRLARVVALGAPVALLGALAVLLLTWGNGSAPRAHAAFDASVNFSISAPGCSSTGTPTATCTEPLSGTFTLAVNLNSLPSNGSYDGYDAKFNYTGGLTTGPSGLSQTGAGNWPSCVFNASLFEAGSVTTGCGFGIGGASSTYTGAMEHLDFTCGATASVETITLVAGDGSTDTVDASSVSHSEAADETLTINCGERPPETPTPTVTPTPCEGPCPTATPTNTPVPPTPTRTPAPKACGDVNDDDAIDPLDAQLILQFSAGLLTTLQNRPSADVNYNSVVDPVDATLILQHSVGLIPASGLHCS